jgi:hypothetical protein
MPPQPLSNVRSNAKAQVSQKALELRPALAPYIAGIIAKWALIEAGIGTMLSFILEAEFAATAAMLSTLRSASAQIDAVAAAGRAKLAGRDLDLFEAVIIIARSAAKKRNAVAHHIWAYSDELPDALLLVEPQAYANIYVNVHTRMATKIFDGPLKMHPPAERVLVYREKDFIEIIEELHAVIQCVVFASFHLDPKSDDQNKHYEMLSAVPLLTDALERVRKNR